MSERNKNNFKRMITKRRTIMHKLNPSLRQKINSNQLLIQKIVIR